MLQLVSDQYYYNISLVLLKSWPWTTNYSVLLVIYTFTYNLQILNFKKTLINIQFLLFKEKLLQHFVLIKVLNDLFTIAEKGCPIANLSVEWSFIFRMFLNLLITSLMIITDWCYITNRILGSFFLLCGVSKIMFYSLLGKRSEKKQWI